MGVSLGLWLLLRAVVPEVLTAPFMPAFYGVCLVVTKSGVLVEPVCVSVVVLPGISVVWIGTLCGFTVVTGSGVPCR